MPYDCAGLVLSLLARAQPGFQGHPPLANDGEGTVLRNSCLAPGQVYWVFNDCKIRYLTVCLWVFRHLLADVALSTSSFWLRRDLTGPEDKGLWLRFGASLMLCSALHCRLTSSVGSRTLFLWFLVLKQSYSTGSLWSCTALSVMLLWTKHSH